jgi:hypothetical protein
MQIQNETTGEDGPNNSLLIEKGYQAMPHHRSFRIRIGLDSRVA